MIKIVAKMVVKEDKVEDFVKAAEELVAKSAAEEGNASYSLNRHLERANEFTFIEFWKDDAALQSHNASAHFTTILPLLAEMTAEAPEINLYSEVTW